MERLIAEIEKVKRDTDELLDRKCVGKYNCDVYFLDNKEELRLSYYFDRKKTCFDYYYAGCYITPGKITTVREIHINALECAIKSKLLDYIHNTSCCSSKELDLFKNYLQEVYEYINKK